MQILEAKYSKTLQRIYLDFFSYPTKLIIIILKKLRKINVIQDLFRTLGLYIYYFILLEFYI